MKYISVLLLSVVAAAAGCTSTSNNANMRGTNTNTGYTVNSETNAKPSMPANVTNISPPAMNAPPSPNRNSNAYVVNSNSNVPVKKLPNTNK